MTSPILLNPDSLEILTSMLNQTLIETGRFFRSEGSLQARAQLKRNLPAAQEQFNSALDTLSEQIFIAKAFLEKEHESVKSRKAALRKRPTDDVVMGEAQVVPQSVSVPEQTAVAASTESDSKVTSDTVKTEQQTDQSQDQQDTANVPAKEENPDIVNIAPTQDAQATGEQEEINFDSLLNNQGSNEFDLNLDFGDDNNAGNENFFNANFGDPSAGSGLDTGNFQMAGTESGQDSNALPTGGDAFDLELQKFSTQPGDPNDQFGDNTEDIMGPGESSFDDLFMESENIGGNDNGDQDLLAGDGLMQLNELDDSWFS
ncbi:uncharacterized protein BDV14DRAFT_75881 [Aspergillus stella-maris]|uniref:uncharacterized protein n=1 Tax=Aspergillus stella-maris TaxID=1810926 RepID=UPI003CCD0B3D